MLLELKVKDIGIIGDIDWRLQSGLNVITGETGAGKSLIIDAVEALLTGRVSEEDIRHGAEEAQIEGVFALPQGCGASRLAELLIGRGLAADMDTLIINCALRRGGRSVVRVNGFAAARDIVQQIGRLMVDIHGQSQHLSLLDPRNHLDILDAYAGIINRRDSFTARVIRLRQIEAELALLTRAATDATRREEFLRFQLDEIEKAKLRDGELEELEQEHRVLSSVETLKSLAHEAYESLSGDENIGGPSSALDRLGKAGKLLMKALEYDPGLKPHVENLEEAVDGLQEIARELHSYEDHLEDDPSRLEQVEARLEQLRNLVRKYGRTISNVIAYQKQLHEELQGLTASSDRQIKLDKERVSLRKELGRIAVELTQSRIASTKKLIDGVLSELNDLGMKDIRFDISVSQETASEGLVIGEGRSCAFNDRGTDIVEFMVATNPGEPLKPLSRIASTGELSRFTLALKGALAKVDEVPVLVFDEIDIGVGGRSGEVIGRKLWLLSRNRQVICVTHLPQIAAYGDAHFIVRKEASGKRTLSFLEVLDGAKRMRELAAMLAGANHTEAALKSATEIARKAGNWKKANG